MYFESIIFKILRKIIHQNEYCTLKSEILICLCSHRNVFESLVNLAFDVVMKCVLYQSLLLFFDVVMKCVLYQSLLLLFIISIATVFNFDFCPVGAIMSDLVTVFAFGKRQNPRILIMSKKYRKHSLS
jgi:hypothetical protein